MLDRESACNRVFLARRFASVRAWSFVFKLAAAPRSTMSSPLPYCRTNESSSDVGVIGMITASARHSWTYRRRNGTKRKFFNDFSRACARVRARRAGFRVWQRRKRQVTVSHLVFDPFDLAGSALALPPLVFCFAVSVVTSEAS